MTRILFICLGNICRSPMAEFVMKDLVEKAGIAEKFEIASAATSAEEVGNPANTVQYLQLGLRSFSVSPQNLLNVKKALREAEIK